MAGNIWILRVLFLLLPVWCFAAVAEIEIQLNSRTICKNETSVRNKLESSLENNFNVDFQQLPTVQFPHMPGSLQRNKREWNRPISPFYFPENDMGPYPKPLFKVKKGKDEMVKTTYMITGPGADLPPVGVFTIGHQSGVLYVTQPLDRENISKYTLRVHTLNKGIEAEEPMELIINVIDQNDNAPEFTHNPLYGQVSESAAIGDSVMQMTAVDRDDPGTNNAIIRYQIKSQLPQNPKENMFAINPETGMVSVIAPGLDRESHPEYKLIIEAADMEGKGLTATGTAVIAITDSSDNAPRFTVTSVPFSGPVSPLTATVTDRKEPPVFNPAEDAETGRDVVKLRAIDPDKARKTSMKYKGFKDAAGWLRFGKDPGSVPVKGSMDRESQFVQDSEYTTMAVAYGKDTAPVTVTGSLMATLLGKNDHRPVVLQKEVSLCSLDPVPVQLDIADPDGPGHTGPFTVELQEEDQINWIIHTNSTSKVALLAPKQELPPGNYILLMRIYDAGKLYQDSTLNVHVCQCHGAADACFVRHSAPPLNIPSVTAAVLGTIFIVLFLLLLLVLLLLLLKSRKRSEEDTCLFKDLPRSNIFFYDEEGGGEEDKEFELRDLHRGLDNHPKIFRSDVFPTSPHPRYPLRPQENEDKEEMRHFIEDSLHIADSDPTVPPYDTLLVFSYEDGASDPDPLSSINSSDSDEDQDQYFQKLARWGPRFSRLADMYAGGTEEDDNAETLPGKK